MTEGTLQTGPRLKIEPRWKGNGEITCSVCGNDKSPEKYCRLYLALKTFHCTDCTRVARKRLTNLQYTGPPFWNRSSGSDSRPIYLSPHDGPTSVLRDAKETFAITGALEGKKIAGGVDSG